MITLIQMDCGAVEATIHRTMSRHPQSFLRRFNENCRNTVSKKTIGLVTGEALVVTGAGKYYEATRAWNCWFLRCVRYSPFKSWQRIYSYDMTFNLTETEASNVLGGEVAMWSEQMDHIGMDGRLWWVASRIQQVASNKWKIFFAGHALQPQRK